MTAEEDGRGLLHKWRPKKMGARLGKFLPKLLSHFYIVQVDDLCILLVVLSLVSPAFPTSLFLKTPLCRPDANIPCCGEERFLSQVQK